MSKKRVTFSALAVTVVAAAICAVGVTPAQAAIGSCNASRFCVWTDNNHTGTLNQYDTDQVPGPSAAGTSSLYNRKAYSIRAWDSTGFSGNSIAFGSGAQPNALSAYNRFGLATWNDAIRSFQPGA